MSYPKVVLGRAARDSVHNTAKLEDQAAALAEHITIPSSLEFARFDHGGKTYAISVRLLVEVDLLNNRVPDVVLRTRPKRGSFGLDAHPSRPAGKTFRPGKRSGQT
jgi:hypothetical protein